MPHRTPASPEITPASAGGENAGKKSGAWSVESSEHTMLVGLDQDVLPSGLPFSDPDGPAAASVAGPRGDVRQQDLIQRCQQGDEAAFRELFESRKDKVYSIALRYAGDPALAMDIAQDTFVKLMDRIGQFRGESNFDSWLFRLVVNSCLDHRRRQSRFLPVVEEFFDSFRAPQESALESLLRDEMQERVREVVAHLAPEHRIVVVLRYTEGLSYEEIAELLQCSRGTVASRLNRAHKVLERRLGALARSQSGKVGGKGRS